MTYRHQHFRIDTDSREVFDENNKQLRLTGNAYRVLVFLCANRQGTVTDIGGFLDWAKDYDENHMRQYRYKINSIIGHDIITYQNGIYLLIGNTEVVETPRKNERNTDLLQATVVNSEQELEDKPITMKTSPTDKKTLKKWSKKSKWIFILCITVLAIIVPVFWNWYTTRISPNTPQTSRINCPSDRPIKGNAQSGIYHIPGGAYYNKTRPERCFASEADAQSAGYRKSTY